MSTSVAVKKEEQPFLIRVNFYAISDRGKGVRRFVTAPSKLKTHHTGVIEAFYFRLRMLLSEYNAFESNKYSPPVVIDVPSVANEEWKRHIEEVRLYSRSMRYINYKNGLSDWKFPFDDIKETNDEDLRSKVDAWVSDVVFPMAATMVDDLYRHAGKKDDVDDDDEPFIRMIYKVRQLVSPTKGLSYSCILVI
jgi:hypothetical protein